MCISWALPVGYFKPYSKKVIPNQKKRWYKISKVLGIKWWVWLKLQHFLSRRKISINKKCKCNITPKDFFSTVKVFFSKIEPKVNLCQISNSKELFIQPESRGKIPHYLKLEKRRFYTRLHRRKLLPKPRDQFDVCK